MRKPHTEYTRPTFAPEPVSGSATPWKPFFLTCWAVWLCICPVQGQKGISGRLAPRLQFGPVQAVRVQASDPEAFAGWLGRRLPGCRITGWRAGTIATVTGLSRSRLGVLLECPYAAFVDVPARPAREELDLDGYDLTLNGIAAAHRQFPDLAGRGLSVSIRERPFDTTDIDFRGRIMPARQAVAEAPSNHATTMASLAAGGGNTSPTSKGVAWQARLAWHSFTELLPDDSRQLAAAGISVQNHSYGTGIEPYYGLESLAYDRECLRTPTLLHVFSAGNAGNQAAATGRYKDIAGFGNLTGQFKLSKNTLCVGGLTADARPVPLSSRGPAPDGRLKPELAAFGNGGTSEAAALVSGLALLLQQAYRQQHGDTLPPAALVKAVLLNSARDVGRPGPDFETGFGNADAPAAIRTLHENRYVRAETGAGEYTEFSVDVPPGTPRLQVTLVWHDPPAAANADTALVNDLDLTVMHPATGRRWLPWVLNPYPHPDSLVQPARRAADHLNNAEQVSVDGPPAGRYVVRVAGHATLAGRQEFGVAYGWPDTAFSWRWPVRGATVRSGTETRLRWQGTLPAAGRLDYRFTGEAGWRRGADVPPGAISALWTPPDTNARAQLRLTQGTKAFLSDTFVVYRPLPLGVGFNCPGEALLQWPSVAGASGYRVYRLGALYLEPWIQTTDTLLLLDSAQKRLEHYAVAPVLAGGGVPGPTLNYTRQGAGCYVRSFLARQPVADSARLDVRLGTVYRLVSATLERQTAAGNYEAVQVLAPLPGLVFSFADIPPVFGRTVYRLALRTEQNTVVYSDPQEVFVLPAGGVLVFPNPVPAGTDLSVVTGTEGGARLFLLDGWGRTRLDAYEVGAIKTLHLPALPSGVYVLQVQAVPGQWLVRKIVVL